MTLWPCPPHVAIWLWGLLPGLLVGYGLRWAQDRWRVYWVRDFDHSQRDGGDGIT